MHKKCAKDKPRQKMAENTQVYIGETWTSTQVKVPESMF